MFDSGSGARDWRMIWEICPYGSFGWGLGCMRGSGHMLSVKSEDLTVRALGEENLTD